MEILHQATLLAGHAMLVNFIATRKIKDLHGFSTDQKNDNRGIGGVHAYFVGSTTCG
jgi:hypothetical protein